MKIYLTAHDTGGYNEIGGIYGFLVEKMKSNMHLSYFYDKKNLKERNKNIERIMEIIFKIKLKIKE